MLYGEISLPDWLDYFIFSPEMLRLRGVGLSNVDGVTHKDFSSVSRWEHSIAVAYLCQIVCQTNGFSPSVEANLLIAALYHDIATPPFAHSAEYVLDGFSHESEGRKLFLGSSDDTYHNGYPVYQGELPSLHKLAKKLRGKLDIDIDKVLNLINGGDELGWLICGTIDIDNVDNVVRASTHMGLRPARDLPLRLVKWLSTLKRMPILSDPNLPPEVVEWMALKRSMYDRYFESDHREIGRESLIHNIIRSLSERFSIRQIIWNTESGLMSLAESVDSGEDISELSKHYNLVKENQLIVKVDIFDRNVVPLISRPAVVAWIAEKFSTKHLKCHAIVKKNRGTHQHVERIFSEPLARLFIFKIGASLNLENLPSWVKDAIPEQKFRNNTLDLLSAVCLQNIPLWIQERPWEREVKSKVFSFMRGLNAVESWEFSETKNSSQHAYPGTFVHAIPSNLISALGLQGELILDPFSGTGQTAAEAVKQGCPVISIDNNSIAILIQKARFTYLDDNSRARVREISKSTFSSQKMKFPIIPDAEKWFHPSTLKELKSIFCYVRSREGCSEYSFLLSAFSAILTSCTHRAGEQHGHFADNTPLPKGVLLPDYKMAIELFLSKIDKNLLSLESFYGQMSRAGCAKIKDELDRISIIHANSVDYDTYSNKISPGSVAGIITSPPYLCMADYTLGQRLSYYWIYPERLKDEHSTEIGTRRSRFSPDKAIDKYHNDMKSFAMASKKLLRRHGLVAFVMGAPQNSVIANRSTDWYANTESIFKASGFTLCYDAWRKIKWHRNHGFAKLNREKVYVFRRDS